MTPYGMIVEWDGLLDRIDGDIENLLLRRYVFREVRTIVDSNPRLHKPSIFYEWMTSTYAASAIMTLRRQADQGKDAVSLWKLLMGIREHAEVLTRIRHVAFYDTSIAGIGEREFDELAGIGQPYMDSRRVQTDATSLQHVTEKLRDYATKRIAHTLDTAPKQIPTFTDLDAAIDLVEVLTKKYKLLIRGQGGDILPTVAFPWKAIFTETWIPPSA